MEAVSAYRMSKADITSLPIRNCGDPFRKVSELFQTVKQ